MNLTTALPQDFSGLSILTNSSLTNLTETSFNQTASIISALSSSGGRTWALKYYWIVSILFLLTIPLFLVAGGILRWSIRSAVRYAVYWRIAALIIGANLFFGCYVGFYWALPVSGFLGTIIFYLITGPALLFIIHFEILFFLVYLGCSVLNAVTREFIPYKIPVFMVFPWTFLLWRCVMVRRQGMMPASLPPNKPSAVKAGRSIPSLPCHPRP